MLPFAENLPFKMLTRMYSLEWDIRIFAKQKQNIAAYHFIKVLSSPFKTNLALIKIRGQCKYTQLYIRGRQWGFQNKDYHCDPLKSISLSVMFMAVVVS